MRLVELFEKALPTWQSKPDRKIVVIFPGRFQPPHTGHLKDYNALVGKFGANNVYISMTDKYDTELSPFTYDERKNIFVKLLNVPADKIIKVSRQYNVEDISKVLDLNPETVVIFAVGKKDMLNNPRFKFTSTSYVQDFYNIKSSPELEPFSERMYILTIPTHIFKATDKLKIKSASAFRKLFKSLNLEGKRRLFEVVYHKFDATIFNVFVQKLQ